MALKDKTEEVVKEEVVSSKPYAKLFSELDEYSHAIASDNIAVVVILGNRTSPTYREVQANVLAQEIKANFS